MRASFTTLKITPEKVFIRDNNAGGMSVTNDAEAVVENLFRHHGERRFIYMDSEGQWDELLHNKETFTNFAVYREETP